MFEVATAVTHVCCRWKYTFIFAKRKKWKWDLLIIFMIFWKRSCRKMICWKSTTHLFMHNRPRILCSGKKWASPFAETFECGMWPQKDWKQWGRTYPLNSDSFYGGPSYNILIHKLHTVFPFLCWHLNFVIDSLS